LARFGEVFPWELTNQSGAVVRKLLAALDIREFNVSGEVAIHKSATVEDGAVIKGPCILGPHCFVAAGAYIRGGNWVSDHCTFGPGSELKSSFVFHGTKLAHFNFVGDSILGSDVNMRLAALSATIAMSAKTRWFKCKWGASFTEQVAISSVR
jgi:NDP-sugar pyrophosphorylase family protein